MEKNIICIGGKYYINCYVVMKSTKNPSSIGYHFDIKKKGSIDYAPNFGFDLFDNEKNYQHRPQYLHIYTEEKLCDDDKNLIASMDKSLNVPIPSNDFCSAYSKENGRSGVLVEVESNNSNKLKIIDNTYNIIYQVLKKDMDKTIVLKNQGLTNSGQFAHNGEVDIDKAFKYYMPSEENLIEDLKICIENKDEENFIRCVNRLADNYYTLFKSFENKKVI